MHRTPIESRLARAGRRSDLRLLQDYARPPKPEPANDNLPSGYSADLRLEVRPSPDELLRLALQDAIVARPYGPVSLADIDRATRQRIRFKDGRIDQWLGGDGRWHSAEPHYRHERGKRRRSEVDMQEDTARHLALPATGQLPSAAYKGTRRPCRYNALLQRLGVSGFYSFDEAWANARLIPSVSGDAPHGRHRSRCAVHGRKGSPERLCLRGEFRRPRQRP
ncbi:hypothetical protein ABIF63_005246 [Bradyrhizobium japonicum]|uniref:Transposase n=1 Tax=Bradyrhizobium japonicum TaxID=375 RepID=A0ABV2RX43_BRAJP